MSQSITSTTFKSSSIQAKVENIRNYLKPETLKALYESTPEYQQSIGGKIIQSSGQDELKLYNSFTNGFVGSIYQAYCSHQRLILRPDDVWVAIETQFSLYMNKHAETLRKQFVKHSGQKELIVKIIAANLYDVDYGKFSQLITNEIHKNVVDEKVVDWLLPNFTTTTDTDRTVASIIIMSAMQKYFTYTCCIECGIPEVTLLGTVEDWKKLRSKIDKLLEYNVASIDQDQECKNNSNNKNNINDQNINVMLKWHSLLAPILDEFVNSAQGRVNVDFWDKVCHSKGGGSGPSYLCGWITAFCMFDKDGNVIKSNSGAEYLKGWNNVTIKDYVYPAIDTNYIPSGVVSVPVKIDDHGTEYKTKMMAGQIGYTVMDKNTIQCHNDWMIALVDEDVITKNTKSQFWF